MYSLIVEGVEASQLVGVIIVFIGNRVFMYVIILVSKL